MYVKLTELDQKANPEEAKNIQVMPMYEIIEHGSTPSEETFTRLNKKNYYVGTVSRAKSKSMLQDKPDGTYLVRYQTEKRKFVISISYLQKVRHVLINCEESNYFNLSTRHHFSDLEDLIEYYSTSPLCEIFGNRLNIRLTNPVLTTKYYKVIQDFDAIKLKPQTFPDLEFISMKRGETVLLIDLVQDDNLLWYGQINDKIGYFPERCVIAE
uniref:SH2 domain-containing protein n=1 Tax=Rhabditophanes sp. KR3021 TaxID=114890 RepID=A0AC35TUU8_9BILA